jgi:hypothetical protein
MPGIITELKIGLAATLLRKSTLCSQVCRAPQKGYAAAGLGSMQFNAADIYRSSTVSKMREASPRQRIFWF